MMIATEMLVYTAYGGLPGVFTKSGEFSSHFHVACIVPRQQFIPSAWFPSLERRIERGFERVMTWKTST